MNTIKRTLAISDIHGELDKFINLLQKVKYNSLEDELILLGDYIDRGSKSKETIEYVKGLVENHNTIALRGNHDQMFLDWLNEAYIQVDQHYFQNGGLRTLESYLGLNFFEEGITEKALSEARQFIKQHYHHHVQFLENLPYYHETEKYIFVHAGIDPFYEDWKKTPKQDLIWIRGLFFNNQTKTDKTVIFGHTPTVNLQSTEDIWFGEDKIGIDGGCAYGLQLNCLEISENGYKQFEV